MIRDKDLIKKVREILDFLELNADFINLSKIKNEIAKLDSKIKNSLIPDDIISKTFSNKSIFPNLTEIKTFFAKNFNIEIKERSKAGIISNIRYYSIIDPTLFPKIQKLINSIKKKQPALVVKSVTPKKKKKIITDVSWKDWIKYKPDELKQHLNNLTVAQIKSLSGKLLSSSEKKVRKTNLIENVINKIIRLETHYKMGPG